MSLNHVVSKQVSTGTNEYVQALLNAGWRWDTSSQTGDCQQIRYAFENQPRKGSLWLR